MLKPGDWAAVRPEHDIPPLLRNGQPTVGRIETVDNGLAQLWVPIGGALVDVHSQAVPYTLDQLEPAPMPALQQVKP